MGELTGGNFHKILWDFLTVEFFCSTILLVLILFVCQL